MVFNNDLIFIHIGKTGGMSSTRYLLHYLRPPVRNCHPDALAEMERLRKRVPKLNGIVPMPGISRHCTLAEALRYIKQNTGKQLGDFKKVIAVVRHPYTLEYSFYRHLQKAEVRERRKNQPKLLELAAGDFKDFVKDAGFHRANLTQDEFVRVSNKIPDCVELVRFEELAQSFPKAVSPFVREDPIPIPITLRMRISSFIRRRPINSFPHDNKTDYSVRLSEILTEEIKELIYLKHRYMFDSGIYSRELSEISAGNHRG